MSKTSCFHETLNCDSFPQDPETKAQMNGMCCSGTSLFKAGKEWDISNFRSVKLLGGLCVTLTGITGSMRLSLVRWKMVTSFCHLGTAQKLTVKQEKRRV